VRHGRGKIEFSDGAVYEGEFRENRRHGRGCQRDTDGSSYDGPWEDDRPGRGHATMVYPCGHRYVGEVVACSRQGEGTLSPPSASPTADSDKFLYRGQWDKDDVNGSGELRAADGTYVGEFREGKRQGKGRFNYRYREPGNHLPVAPSAKQQGESARARSYVGQWDQDQPHGVGEYEDEYGYRNQGARFVRGCFSSERRPPLRGCKETYFANPKWPREDQFVPTTCRATPAGSALPRGPELCRSRGALPSASPAALRPLDVGSGHAHGRIRPAHLGQDGVPGTRWA